MPSGRVLLKKGILIPTTKIEPSYEGYLKLLLFNTTNRKVHLDLEEKAISIIFFSMDHLVEAKKLFSNVEPYKTPPGIWERMKISLRENSMFVSVIVSILCVFLAELLGKWLK